MSIAIFLFERTIRQPSIAYHCAIIIGLIADSYAPGFPARFIEKGFS